MSKKNLLNESTVRKFMKFANLGGLAESFVDENYVVEESEEVVEENEEVVEENEEVVEEGVYAEEEEGLEDLGDELPAEEPEFAEDEGPVDADAEVADTSEASIEALVDALADTITQVTGVEVTAAGDADLDAAPEAEFPADEAPVEDEAPAPAPEAELAPEEDEAVLDEESLMAETLRRVTSRLNGMKKKSDMIERITNRIVERITEKK
jgi:hypothetical protein